MDRSRLEAFSDGVFAVAITLLALNLIVARPGRHDTLLHQLGTHWPVFVAYLISFFIIGIVWVNHHVLVRGIAVVDRTLLFLNLVLLLFVVMIPWATATTANYLAAYLAPHGSYAHRDTQIAMMLYGAVFLGMSAGFGNYFPGFTINDAIGDAFEVVHADGRDGKGHRPRPGQRRTG